MSVVKGHRGSVQFQQSGPCVMVKTLLPPQPGAKYVYLRPRKALELADKLKRAAERAARLKVK